jgi:hypothetical protein
MNERGTMKQKTTRTAASLLLALTLVGCVTNLEAVREYAGESAKLSAYTDLTKRFRDTYEREKPYLSGKADTLARENDKKRKAAYKDLLIIHQRVSLYMQTLAKLAGDETYDISKDVEALASGIASYPDFGLGEKQASAIASISTIITRWITSASQERAVREMVREADPSLQTSLEGMLALVRFYKQTNINERKTVLGFFEVEIPFADAPKDKLLLTLARAHLQAKTYEYDAVQPKYVDAEKGIKSIATGHKDLLENIDRLSQEEVKAKISSVAKDLKAIWESLRAVAGN